MSGPTPDGGRSADDGPRVLAVDDDRDLADTYALWLDGEYEVETAYGGEDALSRIDADVDVVLLDRRMPGMSGGEVLDAIRERDLPCRVAMLTAVEPSADVVDMPFDDYVTKPVTKQDLVDVVEELYARVELDDAAREYRAVASKIAALEADLPPADRASNDALDELRRRADELAAEAGGGAGDGGDVDAEDEADAVREPDF